MADYTPTYPNTTKVETLTSELSSDDSETRYNNVLLIAYEDSDTTITSAFHKNNITPPSSDSELEQIGTLLAASFVFNDFYNDETELSGKGKLYKDEGLRRLSEYVEYMLNSDSGSDESLCPAATYSIEF